MRTGSSRLAITTGFVMVVLIASIVGAVATGTGTLDKPPKVAFVAAGGIFPDALAVGPMAGRLGAPLYLTATESLSEATRDALIAYGAELIIVAGGTNTVHDVVLAEIAAATGLSIRSYDDKPSTGIVRAAGTGREGTAVAVAELLDGYNPAFLPVDATAADADLLDGEEASAFANAGTSCSVGDVVTGIGADGEVDCTTPSMDADTLDGLDSSAFLEVGGDLRIPVLEFHGTFVTVRHNPQAINLEAPEGTVSDATAYASFPVDFFGEALEAVAWEYCYRPVDSTVTKTWLTIMEGDEAGMTVVGEAMDNTLRTGDACETLALDPPVPVTPSTMISVVFVVDFGTQPFGITRSTVLLRSA